MQNKEIRKSEGPDAMIRLSSKGSKTKLTLINQKMSTIQYALHEMETCDKSLLIVSGLLFCLKMSTTMLQYEMGVNRTTYNYNQGSFRKNVDFLIKQLFYPVLLNWKLVSNL